MRYHTNRLIASCHLNMSSLVASWLSQSLILRHLQIRAEELIVLAFRPPQRSPLWRKVLSAAQFKRFGFAKKN